MGTQQTDPFNPTQQFGALSTNFLSNYKRNKEKTLTKCLVKVYSISFVSQTVMATRTSSFSVETPNFFCCWEWSVRPLIIWLHILGVDLPDAIYSSKSYCRWLSLAYRIFCFLLHTSGEINSLLYYLLGTKNDVHFLSLEQTYGAIYITTTATWNWAIDFINYAVHGIGIHVILVTVVRAQWVDLTKIFQRLQEILPDENYIRIRRLSSFGVAYIIFIVRRTPV